MVGIQWDPDCPKNGLGHEIGPAAGTAGTDLLTFDFFDVGDTTRFQSDHLQQIWIHDGHGENLVLLPLELGKPAVSGHGHIPHHLTDDRFTLVG